MGNTLPIWSYSDSGSEEKIANCFPYYGQDEDNFCGMVKIGSVSSGWDEVFEKTDENFIKKTSLSLQLSDIVKRSCGEQDFDFGDVVFGPISNERDENGELINSSIGISLSLDTADEPEILDKEIEKGFYKGNLISYLSKDGQSDTMSILLKVSWVGGNLGQSYKVQCWDGDTLIQEYEQTSTAVLETYSFNNLNILDENDRMITYTFKEVLTSEDWMIVGNNIEVNYNNRLEEHIIENTYVDPQPVVPDWPGLVLWADATVPPENGVWKNQIEETNQDIRLSGSGISANDDEIIFQSGRNFGEYDLPDFATINGAYSFYLIIKSSGVNTFNANSSGFEDIWLRLGNKNAYASAITGLRFGRNYSQPYISSAATGLNAYYGYSACSSQYHVYALTKTSNSTTVKVFLDGVKVKEISVNNVSGFSTPVLIFNRAADSTAVDNSNTNYYKLIAYSTQTHDESDVITYSNLLKQRYHVSGEIENISFENFVNFTPNCTLNTNYTLLSDEFDFIADFVPSNNGYPTYQNYRGNFVYTDSRDLTSISATGSSAYFEFITQYDTGAEVSTAQNLDNNYFYTGTYKDRLKVNINSSSVFVDLRNAAAGSTFRNYGSVSDTAVTPKDSSIKIFGKNGCGFSGSVYSISLLDNDKIVRTFLPASYTNSGNTIRGLYDIVNGVFYSSSGTDQFSL